MSTPEHLTPVISDRGLKYLPEIEGDYGGNAKVYESSSAEEPHVWLRVIDGEEDATLHLSAEAAWKLADQLRYLVRNHYHGDSRPEYASIDVTEVAEDAIGLFLENRDSHGHDEERARNAAIAEINDAITMIKEEPLA